MDWVYISDIGAHEGQDVTLKGWIYNKRSSGKLHFLLIRDGTGVIQGVVSRAEVAPEAFEAAGILTQESSVVVSGKVRADSRAPGGYELSVSDVKPVQIAHEYPISPKEHGVDFLMDHRHLWLRSSRQHAILRIRATIIGAIRGYLDSQGFTLVDSPILTPSACEGTTTLFETTYFDEKAYLSQSGQLYLESAAMALGKVYCFGPAFRAEKSKTRRHLIEFWIVEPEAAYFEHEDNLRLQEAVVTHAVQAVLHERQAELAVLERDVAKLECVQPPFPRITYDRAMEILRAQGVEKTWGEDFGAPDETKLANLYDRPLFVEKYPSSVKAFYMQPDPERPDLALCDDLLAPEGYGEIIGGSQRIHDLALLESRIEQHNLPRDAYEWYLDLRRYGSVPHSGFGLGIERTVAWICGLEHVRETIPFPRMLYRLYP
ncbi:MAG TPA: asparagine--tRNA ligase [Chloroflexota bacterium]|nr:asparagine--tRNA ligase [Chloroflexota bacterium]